MRQLTAKRGENPAAKLATISDAELGELAQFIASQSGREAGNVESHLRWFLLDNPARDPRIPLGLGLRSTQDALVGCILCVPQEFRFQQQTLTVLGSSCFYVDERFRGSGGLLFLRFSQFGRGFVLFGNSANAAAAQLWKACGAVPIPYSDQELFAVLGWQGVTEEALKRVGTPKGLARMASRVATPFVAPLRRLRLDADSGGELVRLTSAEQVMELPVQGASSELTANRDSAYLRWRYFSGRDASVGVFAFRRGSGEPDVLVTVNQRPRGYRGQISALHVLDIYPRVKPALCASVIAALVERYRGTVDAIVLRGFDEAHQRLFQDGGFVRRQFDAPNGWFLDRSKLLPTKDWYLVPADGDWLI